MPAGTEVEPSDAPTHGWTLERGVGAVIALVGAVIGMGRLSDNSFFTHLATGRVILDTGSVPTVDPYTYHSLGRDWTVQSWLVSLVYAVSDEVAGLAGPRLVHMALGAAAASIIWWLSRDALSLVPRVGVAAVGIAAGAWMWVERPLMVGLVCFGLLLLLTRRGNVWWAVPLMWVWVNSHGTVPYAIVLVAAVLAGRRLDGADLSRTLRLGAAVVVGVLAGGLVTAIPVRLLTFPLMALSRADQLQAVTEWQSPDFADLGPRLFLVQLALAMIAATRVRRWEVLVPGVVFAVAALLSVRNVPLAALALTPWLAVAAPELGTLRADVRSRLGTVLGALALAGAGVALAGLVGGEHIDPWTYPIAEVVALEDEGVLPSGAKVAYEDQVGNYLEYRYGPTGDVFFDDRFDFYDEATLADMIDLHKGRHVLEVLDRFDVEVVVWKSDTTVAEVLDLSDEWVADEPLAPLPGAPAAEDGTTGWTIFRRR